MDVSSCPSRRTPCNYSFSLARYLPSFPVRVSSSLAGPEEYHFVNQGDCFDLRKVEDEDEFGKTKDGLFVSFQNLAETSASSDPSCVKK